MRKHSHYNQLFLTQPEPFKISGHPSESSNPEPGMNQMGDHIPLGKVLHVQLDMGFQHWPGQGEVPGDDAKVESSDVSESESVRPKS